MFRMNIHARFGPDKIVGPGDFIFGRPLGVEALFDLFLRPAPGQQALALGGSGTGHTKDGVELDFGLGFEQERDDDHRERPAFGPPGLDLGPPERADARDRQIEEDAHNGKLQALHDRLQEENRGQPEVALDDFLDEKKFP